MEIHLNGEARTLSHAMTLLDLARACGIDVARVAIAVNAAVVPRSALAATPVRDGDRVEIVQAVGGG